MDPLEENREIAHYCQLIRGCLSHQKMSSTIEIRKSLVRSLIPNVPYILTIAISLIPQHLNSIYR